MININFLLGLMLTVFFSTHHTLKAQEKPKELSRFIKKKQQYNKNSKSGFSVILYNGNETKALKIYKQFKKDFKEINIKLTYVSPDWKVITPAYKSKLEAEKISLFIQEKYPNAKVL